MSNLLILGTDTDAGKTTFCATWLSLFANRYAYWKPLETGESDSGRVRSLVPNAHIFPALASLKTPVAPLLAARLEGITLPSVDEIVARVPVPVERCHLLIETFGSPWSPLDEEHLQIDLIKRIDATCVLVSSSKLGAIGRTMQCLMALKREGIVPAAVVLVGEQDDFAVEQLTLHGGVTVFSVASPKEWTEEGFQASANAQRDVLEAMESLLSPGNAALIPGLGGVDESWGERDARALWHPYTSLHAPRPLMCVEAKGEFLILDDGRRIIDGISSWWTIQHGHRDAELTNALRSASDQLDHVLFAGMTHPWAIELAERLLASTHMKAGRVFYSDNGSTAVEIALKLAYQYWRLHGQQGRTRFVGFEHGYHGDTFGAMSVSRDPVFFGQFEPLLFHADILSLDPKALDEHLARVGSQTAAVIVEPLVQGAGGMRMHTPQTLQDLYAVARKHNVLFIADEVMTAGRLRTRWAYQSAGIEPDLICAAKTIAGGILPFAATLISQRVVAAFDGPEAERTFFHGHSFTGWPLACAVALANQRKMDRFKTAGLPTVAMETAWHELLEPLQGRKNVREVRVLGSIAAIEIEAPGGYLSQIARQMREAALEEGVFLRPLGNVLYAMPPYCTSRQSLEQIARALEKALQSVGHVS